MACASVCQDVRYAPVIDVSGSDHLVSGAGRCEHLADGILRALSLRAGVGPQVAQTAVNSWLPVITCPELATLH